MTEYTFSVRFAPVIVRVEAADEATARAEIIDKLEAADANLGAWGDGEPILCELSLQRAELIEIDGDDVEGPADV